MTIDPVFRAVVHTGNARDLLLAESPASVDALSDRCPSAGTAILRERTGIENRTDETEVERDKCLLCHHDKSTTHLEEARTRSRNGELGI